MLSQGEVPNVLVGPECVPKISIDESVRPEVEELPVLLDAPDENSKSLGDIELENFRKTKDPVQTPQNYTLSNARDPENPEVHFYVFGCGGVGNDYQKKVAELMHKIAFEGKKKPKFIIILGDNFYNNGVTSEFDPAFKSKFEDIYQDKALTGIYGIPCFLIPGNHDHNVHYWGAKNGNIDFSCIAGQINYSRLVDGKKSPLREAMFAGDHLDLKKLGVFNMPTRFYSCTIEAEEKNEQNLEMYFIDSTTYVKDYLQHIFSEKNNPNNQAAWLEMTAKKDSEAIKLLFSHHPRYSLDKRFFHSDAHYHLSDSEVNQLKQLKIEGNYNQMLDAILRRQGLSFDANFSAHTHSLYYHYSNEGERKLCQVGVGGGGGALEDRQKFTKDDSYLKQHGFGEVHVDVQTKVVTCDLHSVDGHHLKFKNNSAAPIRFPVAETSELILLRTAVLEACRKYYDFLQKPLPVNASTISWAKHYLNHGASGANRADDLVNFFNRYEPVTFDEASEYVINRMQRWSQVKGNSLESYLSEATVKHFGLTWREYAEKYAKNKTLSPTNQEAEAKPAAPPVQSAGMIGMAAAWVGSSILGSLPHMRRSY